MIKIMNQRYERYSLTFVAILYRDWYYQSQHFDFYLKLFQSFLHIFAKYQLHPNNRNSIIENIHSRLTRLTYSYFCGTIHFFTNQLLPAKSTKLSIYIISIEFHLQAGRPHMTITSVLSDVNVVEVGSKSD